MTSVMLVTSFIGAFVSNTGTVALMMPIIMSIAAGSGMQSSRFLMPLAFAGSLGGMLTLIGTPPNLVIDEVLTEGGYQPLAFFSFFPVGIIVIAIGIIVLMPLSKIFLSKKQSGKKKKQGKSLDDLVDEYQLLDNLHRYIVPSRRPSAAIDENGEQMDIVGKTLKDLSIQKKYGVSIIEIRNEKKSRLGLVKDVSQNMAKSSSTIQVHDTLYIIGEEEKMKRFASDYGLRKMKDVKIDFYDLGLTEIVVMPTSNFAGLRIGEANLRKRFGINVLGVKRGDAYCGEECEFGQILGMPASFKSPKEYVEKALAINNLPGNRHPKIHAGQIVSGEWFVDSKEKMRSILEHFPQAMAVDMESCSIAQTCHIYKTPFISFRIISDIPLKDTKAQQYFDFWAKMAEGSFNVTKAFLESL